MIAAREIILPILEDHGVDLVLSGHSHTYERTFLVDGAYDTPTTPDGHILDGGDGRIDGDGPYLKPRGLEPHSGTVCVIAGHGAGGQAPGSHPLMAYQEGGGGACLLRIDGNELTFENVRDEGVISDRFVISKVCLADLDGDDGVGIGDLLALLEAWGTDPGGPPDLDHDGIVGIGDLLALLARWGPCI
jgi:hypothetical protein